MTPAPTEPTIVEVFADVVCPFTHIAILELVTERERRGRDDVVFRLRAWPLELVNGELQPRDLITEEIAELRRAVAPERFRGFDPGLFPMSSLPALSLAEHAYRDGLPTGEQLSLALRRALFEEGRDVSDPDVLAGLARTFGLDAPDPADAAAVRSDLAEGRERGVVGSPHFFVGGSSYFAPSVDVSEVAGRIVVTRDEEGYDEIIRACFGA